MSKRDGSEDPTIKGTDAPAEAAMRQLTPGDVIGDRYRIVDLLGAGGMGQVYRADDLKLDQPVALKFLPRAMAKDAAQLERLKQEVRLGRTIAHPNVCRIYDLGESEHSPFVAMELVRGEDLASLLRRIGRLPETKAFEIARQLCAGLAAVHARGILHRDLKPANVMLDQDGHVRITDFGLAVDSSTGDETGLIVGTPAYMSPEQLRGERATEQSDLYALGLVLSEICTGRRVRTTHTVEDLRQESSEIRPLDPSLDPRVHAAIAACLDPDPAQRPRSAHHVLRMLPGGDPLAEAVAAGITPSPDLVAAAPAAGRLRSRFGWAYFAAILALLTAGIIFQHRANLARSVGLRAPDVMKDRVEGLLTELGYEDLTGSTLARYQENRAITDLAKGAGAEQIALQQRRIEYFHRIYPPTFRADYINLEWFGDSDEPPPGSVNVTLDAKGNLVSFESLPGKDLPLPASAGWDPLLRAAGLGAVELHSVEPARVPRMWADERLAWTATAGQTPLRIEAASREGRPVSFFVRAGPEQAAPPPPRVFEGRVFAYVGSAALLLLMVSGAGLAWLNVRRRRVDVSGTFRLAIFVFILHAAGFLLIEPHSSSLSGEFGTLLAALQSALISAVVLAIFYMAIEPVVRRRWPELIISWTRLLHTGWKDPLVARDVLIGTAMGLLHSVLPYLYTLAGSPDLGTIGLEGLSAFRHTLAMALIRVSSSVTQAMVTILALVVMLIVFRRRGIALAATYVLLTALFSFAYQGAGPGALPIVMAMVMALLMTVVLRIAGPLGIAVMQAVFFITFHAVIAPPAPWALPGSLLSIGFVLFLAFYGVTVATGLREALATRLDSIG